MRVTKGGNSTDYDVVNYTVSALTAVTIITMQSTITTSVSVVSTYVETTETTPENIMQEKSCIFSLANYHNRLTPNIYM